MQNRSTSPVLVIDEISSGTVVVTLEVEVADCEVWAVVIASVVVNGSGNMVHTMIKNYALQLAWFMITYRKM
jgi:hypothetical protein